MKREKIKESIERQKKLLVKVSIFPNEVSMARKLKCLPRKL